MELSINICTRCGKERIKSHEKTVLLNNFQTKITVYVCPDNDCQKVVEEKLAEKELKRLSFLNRKAGNSEKTAPVETPTKNKK